MASAYPYFIDRAACLVILCFGTNSESGHSLHPCDRSDIKVRPVGFISDMNVVTLEEADRRYNERHGYALPDPYADYGKDCFVDSCSLEVTLLIAKYSLANWLRP